MSLPRLAPRALGDFGMLPRMPSKHATPLRLAIVGAGFWARFQVRAWRELERQGLVQLVTLCGRSRTKLDQFLEDLGTPSLPIYTDLEKMLREVPSLGFVDLITTTPTHYSFAQQVLTHRVPVIVQKPMAQTLTQAIAMVKTAQQVRVPLLVHEDFRWQKPFVTFKQLIADRAESLGALVDMRVEWESGGEDFLRGQSYFAEQPFLVNGEVGVHLIDILRFLAGCDVTRVTSAHMHRGVDERYRGEDIAHVTLDLEGGISAAYRVAFSAARRDERPPQTFVKMTFKRGTIELGADYEVTISQLERNPAGGVTREVTTLHAPPDAAAWTQDPSLRDYQSWLGQWESCLPTNRSCAEFILGKPTPPRSVTTGEDNLNVLATMFAAYLAQQQDTRVEIPLTLEGLESLARRLDDARIGYPDFPEENQVIG
jgi:D-apiose dehydrogenase